MVGGRNCEAPRDRRLPSVDQQALDDYLRANPGKTAFDYLQEKSKMGVGARPTALMQNSKYLAGVLGISEAGAAKIASQTREQSDSAYYSDVYKRALANPATAYDADKIAREAVEARKKFSGAP